MLEFPDRVDLVPHAKARRLALRVDPAKRRIRLVYPPRTPKSLLWKFANQNIDWINRQLSALPDVWAIAHGSELPLFGTPHLLDINYDPALKRTSILLENNVIRISTNKDDPTMRLRRHLNALLLEKLEPLVEAKAAAIGRKVVSIGVRDTKSRWGSCAHDGRLQFSRRLVYVPHNVLDYVVAHEVAHLQHMDHSSAFWQVCADLSVDYGASKQWLRSQGVTVHQYP
jgi:predicted metal-dependent hydrolase